MTRVRHIVVRAEAALDARAQVAPARPRRAAPASATCRVLQRREADRQPTGLGQHLHVARAAAGNTGSVPSIWPATHVRASIVQPSPCRSTPSRRDQRARCPYASASGRLAKICGSSKRAMHDRPVHHHRSLAAHEDRRGIENALVLQGSGSEQGRSRLQHLDRRHSRHRPRRPADRRVRNSSPPAWSRKISQCDISSAGCRRFARPAWSSRIAPAPVSSPWPPPQFVPGRGQALDPGRGEHSFLVAEEDHRIGRAG